MSSKPLAGDHGGARVGSVPCRHQTLALTRSIDTHTSREMRHNVTRICSLLLLIFSSEIIWARNLVLINMQNNSLFTDRSYSQRNLNLSAVSLLFFPYRIGTGIRLWVQLQIAGYLSTLRRYYWLLLPVWTGTMHIAKGVWLQMTCLSLSQKKY